VYKEGLVDLPTSLNGLLGANAVEYTNAGAKEHRKAMNLILSCPDSKIEHFQILVFTLLQVMD
jgi:hypothetical protein